MLDWYFNGNFKVPIFSKLFLIYFNRFALFLIFLISVFIPLINNNSTVCFLLWLGANDKAVLETLYEIL
jgi:hypothetical protein